MTFLASPGNYTVEDTVLEVEFDGEKHKYPMMQVRYSSLRVEAGRVAQVHDGAGRIQLLTCTGRTSSTSTR